MSVLDIAIRGLVDAGNFSHLSIMSSGGGFHATFCPAAIWGSGHAHHADPVEAALEAIKNAPKGPKKKEVQSPAPSRRSGTVVHPSRGGLVQASEPAPPAKKKQTRKDPEYGASPASSQAVSPSELIDKVDPKEVEAKAMADISKAADACDIEF
jgi:hypothetical protein